MISACPGAMARTMPERLTDSEVESVERQCTRPRISRVPWAGNDDPEGVRIIRAQGRGWLRQGEVGLG